MSYQGSGVRSCFAAGNSECMCRCLLSHAYSNKEELIELKLEVCYQGCSMYYSIYRYMI